MLSTKAKIRAAAMMSGIVRAARRSGGALSDQVIVKRDGIIWQLDLTEGIDFAIYLKLYERSTTKVIRRLVKRSQTALDIGANIGAHTLEIARQVGPTGRVYAFEPTSFAYSKLCTNLSLNPSLSKLVTAEQMMLCDSDRKDSPPSIYSSWPLVSSEGGHTQHLGQLRTTQGSRATTLDAYLLEVGAPLVDFIKLDVDGFECEVLAGAETCLRNSRPTISMELAPYVLRERGRSLGELMGILVGAGYRFERLNGAPLWPDWASVERQLPAGSSMNIIARPASASDDIS